MSRRRFSSLQKKVIMKKLIASGLLASVFTFTPFLSTQAAIVLLMTEVGNDVVLTSSGSVSNPLITKNFAPNINVFGTSISANVNPSVGTLVSGSRADGWDAYTNALVGSKDFGPGTVTIPATTTTGPVFGIDLSTNPNQLIVDYDELFDDTLGKGTGATWENQTLESLGITPGTYAWTLDGRFGRDTITLTAAVPEPSLLSLAAAAMAGGFVLLRRRRR